MDVHAHAAASTTARSLLARIACKDTEKRNGKGSIESLRRARATAETAKAAADAARRAARPDARALAAQARRKRAICSNVYHGGYDIAAAAAGDTFFPAGFSEFCGWSDSAKAMLKHITHAGDELAANEPGDRFDGGAAASWATRTHRAFTVHTVAVAAARAAFKAVQFDSDRTARRTAMPPSAKFSHKYHAHNARNTSKRSAFMAIQATP